MTRFDDRLLADILREVGGEIERASAKHGDECMASPTITDDGKRLGILAEEVGEACDEVDMGDHQQTGAATMLAGALGRVAKRTTYDNGDPEALDEELVQVAAMAISWLYANRARFIAAISG